MNARQFVEPMDGELDLVFGALSDRTRRAILARLAQGEASVNELVGGSELSQPAISKHLKVLERARLVRRSRAGKFRPCRLEPAPLRAAAAWLGNYQRCWAESLDNLEDYAKEVQGKPNAAGDSKHVNGHPKPK